MSSSDWRDEDFQLTHDAIFSLSKVTSVLLNLCMFKFYLNPECIIFQLKCLIGTNTIFSLKCVVFISVYIGTHCMCIYVYLHFNVHFTVKSTQHKNHFNYYYPLLEPKIHVSCKWKKVCILFFYGQLLFRYAPKSLCKVTVIGPILNFHCFEYFWSHFSQLTSHSRSH